MPSYNIFLSSTFADFEHERKGLMETLSLLEVHCTAAERIGDIGTGLSDTLMRKIDQCEVVVLLISSRAGTESDTGETWTRKEFDYAVARRKRIFAYIREFPPEYQTHADVDPSRQAAVEEFKVAVQKKISIVPRFLLGECCKLTAMVARDVGKYKVEKDMEASRKENQRIFSEGF